MNLKVFICILSILFLCASNSYAEKNKQDVEVINLEPNTFVKIDEDDVVEVSNTVEENSSKTTSEYNFGKYKIYSKGILGIPLKIPFFN